MENKPTATEQAAQSASRLVLDTASASDERVAKIVSEEINSFFNKEQENKRFLDVARIPFICDDIKQIKYDVKAITRLIYIGMGILTVVALLTPFFLKFIK